jgi:HAD superfamily hydrolase (TIGR01490 family)
MALAIFDLDNTLLAGDSDHRWGEFLCDAGLVQADTFRLKNDAFYADYQSGQLDMAAYLDFVLEPLTGMTRSAVRSLQRQFITECIEPMLLDKAFDLLNEHRIKGDTLLMMTATHAVVAEPVAARLGFEHWLGSGVGIRAECYTGKAEGNPCFQEGKVSHLADWQSQHPHIVDSDDSWFYSDSHNDLPLLSAVGRPVAVDPDDTLRAHAEAHQWPILSLR